MAEGACGPGPSPLLDPVAMQEVSPQVVLEQEAWQLLFLLLLLILLLRLLQLLLKASTKIVLEDKGPMGVNH